MSVVFCVTSFVECNVFCVVSISSCLFIIVPLYSVCTGICGNFILQNVYPFTCLTFRLFPVFDCYKKVAMKIHVEVFVWTFFFFLWVNT